MAKFFFDFFNRYFSTVFDNTDSFGSVAYMPDKLLGMMGVIRPCKVKNIIVEIPVIIDIIPYYMGIITDC